MCNDLEVMCVFRGQNDIISNSNEDVTYVSFLKEKRNVCFKQLLSC